MNTSYSAKKTWSSNEAVDSFTLKGDEDCDTCNFELEASFLESKAEAKSLLRGSNKNEIETPAEYQWLDETFIQTEYPLPTTRLMEQFSLWRKLATKTINQVSAEGDDSSDIASVQCSLASLSSTISSSNYVKTLTAAEKRDISNLASHLCILYIARKIFKDLAMRDKSSNVWHPIHLAMEMTLKKVPKEILRMCPRSEKNPESAEDKLQLRVGSFEILKTLLKTRKQSIDGVKAKEEMAYASWKIISLIRYCLENKWKSLADIPDKAAHLDSQLRLPQNSSKVLDVAFQIIKPFSKKQEWRDMESLKKLIFNSENDCEHMNSSFLDDSVADLIKTLEIHNLVLDVVRKVMNHSGVTGIALKRDLGTKLIGNIYLLMQKMCQLVYNICLPSAVLPIETNIMKDSQMLLGMIKNVRGARSTSKRGLNGNYICI
jgi:hypothetical protein